MRAEKKVVQRMRSRPKKTENSRDVHSETNEMSFTIFHFLFYPDRVGQLRGREIFFHVSISIEIELVT